MLPEEIKLRKYSFGGKLVYLTFLNAVSYAYFSRTLLTSVLLQMIQMFFHLIALANEFFGTIEPSPSNPPLIRRIRDYIFAAMAFPLAANVTIVFWFLHSIDRELVFPRVMDPIYPQWLNHILHTNVFLMIIVELFISHHNYPSRKACLGGLSSFCIAYIAWVYIVKHIAGAWVYPILYVLRWHERICFFALVALVPIIFYFVGEFVNEKVWSSSANKKLR